MRYVEIVDGKIHKMAATSSSIREAEGNIEGRTFRENYFPTGGASIGTPVTQMDPTGRFYTPEEILKKRILVPGKNQSLTLKPDVPEYEVVADYTKTPFYLRESGVEIRLELGHFPDKTKLTTVPPPEVPATFNGKVWTIDSEVLAQRIRVKRFLLLSRSDRLLIPDYPVKDLEAVKLYRQQLRDITKQPNFPTSVVFPDPPEDFVASFPAEAREEFNTETQN